MNIINPEATIDLRSDTVTQPTDAMRKVMANAEVGDDVFGDDPTVNLLENKVANLLGKEAGLFVSSGTQSNLLAILCHCQRGEEYITGINYHSFCHEAGGASVLGGVVPYTLATDDNDSLEPSQVGAAIKPDDPHYPISRLLCLENTVNGKVQPTELIEKLSSVARSRGLKVHLDGARLMNAAVALSSSAGDLATSVDSVSLCFSKGLGAPVGSVLSGTQSFINRARRLRKMLGGGTRQAGVLAACGLYALEHNVDRLVEDHENALRLAEGLSKIPQLKVHTATNMVFITPPQEDSKPLAEYLANQNIIIELDSPNIRLVTHLDINRENIDTVTSAITGYFT